MEGITKTSIRVNLFITLLFEQTKDAKRGAEDLTIASTL